MHENNLGHPLPHRGRALYERGLGDRGQGSKLKAGLASGKEGKPPAGDSGGKVGRRPTG